MKQNQYSDKECNHFRKLGNTSIVIALLLTFIIFGFFFSGCSASRKKDKTVTDETVKIELTDKSKTDKSENVNSNVKFSEITTINDKDQTTTVEEIIEPLDPAKEAVFTDAAGKMQVLNNSKKTIKTTIKSNNTKTENIRVTEASVQSNKKESEQKDLQAKEQMKKKASNLHVETENMSWSWLWVLCIVLFFWLWSRYKFKIIAFKNSFF